MKTIKNMKEKKNYCITLHAVGRKERRGWQGFDKSTAHFSTTAEVGSIEWEEAKMKAVDKCWSQEQRYWLGYRLGNAKVQTGREPVSVMSPAYEYHKGRTFPVWEEVK